jgi:hypothetical protein
MYFTVHPTMKHRVGHCLGPKGSVEIAQGEGMKGSRAPPGEKGDKQSAPSKGDKQSALANGDKQPAPNKGDRQLNPNEEGGNKGGGRKEESGMTKRSQHAQSEHLQRAIENVF